MFIKVLIPVLFIISILILAPLFWIVYADNMQQNITVSDQYKGQWDFMGSINYVIAVVLSNLGYVLALMLIVGILVGAIVLVGARYVMG